MNQQELNNRPKHIVIMGAGLVGSMHAIYLARRGYQVSVYEQLPDIRKEAISAGRSINYWAFGSAFYRINGSSQTTADTDARSNVA